MIEAAIRGPITQGYDIGEAMGNAVLEASAVVLLRHDFAHELVVVADAGYAELLRPILEQRVIAVPPHDSSGTTARSVNLAVFVGMVCVALHVADPLH